MRSEITLQYLQLADQTVKLTHNHFCNLANKTIDKC